MMSLKRLDRLTPEEHRVINCCEALFQKSSYDRYTSSDTLLVTDRGTEGLVKLAGASGPGIHNGFPVMLALVRTNLRRSEEGELLYLPNARSIPSCPLSVAIVRSA
jgi:hypothetical protein